MVRWSEWPNWLNLPHQVNGGLILSMANETAIDKRVPFICYIWYYTTLRLVNSKGNSNVLGSLNEWSIVECNVSIGMYGNG